MGIIVFVILTTGTKWLKAKKYMRQIMHLYRKFLVQEFEPSHKPSQANNQLQGGKCRVEHTEESPTSQKLSFPSSSFQIRSKQVTPWP